MRVGFGDGDDVDTGLVGTNVFPGLVGTDVLVRLVVGLVVGEFVGDIVGDDVQLTKVGKASVPNDLRMVLSQ